jgi:hypothetical protein
MSLGLPISGSNLSAIGGQGSSGPVTAGGSNPLGGLLSGAGGAVTGALGGVANGLPTPLGGLVSGVNSVAGGALSGVGGLLSGVLGGSAATPAAGAGALVSNVAGAAGNLLSGVGAAATSVLGGVASALPGPLGGAVSGVNSLAGGVLSGAGGVLSNPIGAAGALPTAVGGAVSNVGAGAAGALTGVGGVLTGAVGGVAGSLPTPLGGIVSGAGNAAGGAVSGAAAAVSGVAGGLGGAVGGLLGGLLGGGALPSSITGTPSPVSGIIVSATNGAVATCTDLVCLQASLPGLLGLNVNAIPTGGSGGSLLNVGVKILGGGNAPVAAPAVTTNINAIISAASQVSSVVGASQCNNLICLQASLPGVISLSAGAIPTSGANLGNLLGVGLNLFGGGQAPTIATVSAGTGSALVAAVTTSVSITPTSVAGQPAPTGQWVPVTSWMYIAPGGSGGLL